MSETPDTVVVEADLEAPPEKVWRALNEPDLRAAWLLPGGAGAEIGDRFTLDDEGRKIDCQVLEADPERRLRLGWRETGGDVDSEVSFDLTPTPAGGTRLRVGHAPVVVRLADFTGPTQPRRRGLVFRTTSQLRMAA